MGLPNPPRRALLAPPTPDDETTQPPTPPQGSAIDLDLSGSTPRAFLLSPPFLCKSVPKMIGAVRPARGSALASAPDNCRNERVIIGPESAYERMSSLAGCARPNRRAPERGAAWASRSHWMCRPRRFRSISAAASPLGQGPSCHSPQFVPAHVPRPGRSASLGNDSRHAIRTRLHLKQDGSEHAIDHALRTASIGIPLFQRPVEAADPPPLRQPPFCRAGRVHF